MTELERIGSSSVDTLCHAAIDQSRIKASLPSHDERVTQYLCRHCECPVTTDPECEDGNWFLRCLVCGAKNVIVVRLQIIGWKR